MNRKFRTKGKGQVIRKILRIPLFLILALLAVSAGMWGGNAVSHMRIDVVKNIEVENFKYALNNSFPIIDTIYNSGNIKPSVVGELEKLVENIFDFNLNNPLTLLNVQSPMIYSYYHNIYLPKMAKGQEPQGNLIVIGDPQNGQDKDDTTDLPETSKENTSQNTPGDTANANPGEGQAEPDQAKQEEPISFAYYEPEPEKRDPNSEKISGDVLITNESNHKIDSALITKLLKEPLKLGTKKKGPEIAIYHTHTSEGMIRKAEDLNKRGIATSTRDNNYNIVRVGDELGDNLRKYGFNVLHNATINDADYNKSYPTALKTITSILKGNPSIRMVFDVHRDGLDPSKPKLRLIKKINGKNAAQIMFVMGSESKTLLHPNWKENLKLAVKLQNRLNQIAPGLARPIHISKYRYNQHVSNGALIIEIGGDGNLLSEDLESTKYLAQAVNDVLNNK